MIALGAMLASACGPSWPGAVTSAHVRAMPRAATVDILPLDLEVWTEPGYGDNIEALRGTAEMHITNVALDALAHRSYAVGALIDWNGDYPGGTALAHRALLATVGSLARYGTTLPPGELPRPHLPVRLGEITGSEATLYIGGWSYVANHHESTADKVAKGVAIALVVVALVAVIAAVASKSNGGHHASGGGDRGALADAVVSVSRNLAPAVVETAAEIATDAALEAASSHPSWATDPALPHDGDSRMFLEMTLVDNRTGLALWHAHQGFPANASSTEDVERAAKSLLASLPAG
jgi:hypothetical protein